MIISASRRTDIPSCHSDWFLRRIGEGWLDVRNPVNVHQISRISLRPEDVDFIVLWTKNPLPMIPRLKDLSEYKYCFQFTLTGYGRDAEPGVPDKPEQLIPAFVRLAEMIGPERMIWRYDPVFLSGKYTKEYHVRAFLRIAEALRGATDTVVISFIDLYAKTMRNGAALGMRAPSFAEIQYLAERMGTIAAANGMRIQTCAETADLSAYGFRREGCISGELAERMLGHTVSSAKDKNQRGACLCMESVEVGAYDTCGNGCLYCYANRGREAVRKNRDRCDPASSVLCGALSAEDVIKGRKIKLLDGDWMDFGEQQSFPVGGEKVCF